MIIKRGEASLWLSLKRLLCESRWNREEAVSTVIPGQPVPGNSVLLVRFNQDVIYPGHIVNRHY